MPTKIGPLSVTRPGHKGLNTEQEYSVLGPDWCVEALNCVLDSSGNLASRRGWSQVTTTPISGTPDIEQIYEYINSSGSTSIISAAGNKIYSGTETLTDITPTTTPTDNHWQFQNFNGKCVGWQKNHTPIVYTGSGSFADIVVNSGTQPQGSCCLSAFGRVWACDANGTVIRYSALLDETRWDSADGGGSIDLKSVWTQGMDVIKAITAFNGQLIIFGKKTIVVYDNPSVPADLTLVEVVYGIGCVARDSIQDTGSDLLFLSSDGIRTLSRTIIYDKMPVSTLTKNVRGHISGFINGETKKRIKSTYSELHGFYLLSFPTFNTTFCLDVGRPLEDNSAVVTLWDNITPKAMFSAFDDSVYLGQAGVIGKYDTYSDNGTSFKYKYKSGWVDFGDLSVTKILKKLYAVLKTGSTNTVTFKWFFNFNSIERTKQKIISSDASSEFNIAEFGENVYSGDSSLVSVSFPLSGHGRVIQIVVTTNISSQELSLQQLDIFIIPGRIG